MTQITATLDNNADPNLIRKIFENVKGVLFTTVKSDKEDEKGISLDNLPSEEKKEWLNKLNRLYDNVDREAIDLNDERTQYILSK